MVITLEQARAEGVTAKSLRAVAEWNSQRADECFRQTNRTPVGPLSAELFREGNRLDRQASQLRHRVDAMGDVP